MIKTSFTCNSLSIKTFFRFLLVRMFCWSGKRLRSVSVNDISSYFHVKPQQVFLFGSARMGLFTLLSSSEDNDKDEVIVAGYTCVVVTNAIKYAGLKAIYIDVEEEQLNINPDLLRAAINEKTRAIIFTHNFGITCEYIQEFKDAYPEVMMLEDTAHTFGSTTANGKKAGLIGHASFFSLEYSKPITSGMGGIILVNDENLLQKVYMRYKDMPFYSFFTRFRILVSLKVHVFTSSRNTAFLKRWMTGFLYVTGLLYKSAPGELKGERPKHYPVRLSAGLAYVAALQVRNMESINAKKDELVKTYYTTFENIPGIKQYYSPQYNYVRYPLLFDEGIKPELISEIRRELKRNGIVVGEWFNDVVHPKGSLRYCYIDGSCAVGESVAERMINFPVSIHKQLNKKDLNKARSILLKHLTNH